MGSTLSFAFRMEICDFYERKGSCPRQAGVAPLCLKNKKWSLMVAYRGR